MKRLLTVIAVLSLLYFIGLPDDLSIQQLLIRVIISLTIFAVSTAAHKKRVHRRPSNVHSRV